MALREPSTVQRDPLRIVTPLVRRAILGLVAVASSACLGPEPRAGDSDSAGSTASSSAGGPSSSSTTASSSGPGGAEGGGGDATTASSGSTTNGAAGSTSSGGGGSGAGGSVTSSGGAGGGGGSGGGGDGGAGGGAGTCGDGSVDADEECDDDGVEPGDGCDEGCRIEATYECEGEPSVCEVGTCGNGVLARGQLCFADPVHYAGPRRGELLDFDGDGNLDLLSSSEYPLSDSGVRLCPGDGTGVFGTGSDCHEYAGYQLPTFALLRPGGTGLDVAAIYGTDFIRYAHRQDGVLAVDPWQEVTTGFYASFALGDLDENGSNDVVVVAKNPSVRVYLNDGAGDFPGPPTYSENLDCETDRKPLVADFFEDGHLDVLVSCFHDGGAVPSLRLFRGDGTGQLEPTPIDTDFGLPAGFALIGATADLDGDDHLDIAIGRRQDESSTGGSVEVLRGLGDGTFEGRVHLVPTTPTIYGNYPQFVDLDNDGLLDVVATFQFPGENAYVFRGDGTGAFGAAELLVPDRVVSGSNTSISVYAFDLNGDGATDLLRGTPTSDFENGAGLDVLFADP